MRLLLSLLNIQKILLVIFLTFSSLIGKAELLSLSELGDSIINIKSDIAAQALLSKCGFSFHIRKEMGESFADIFEGYAKYDSEDVNNNVYASLWNNTIIFNLSSQSNNFKCLLSDIQNMGYHKINWIPEAGDPDEVYKNGVKTILISLTGDNAIDYNIEFCNDVYNIYKPNMASDAQDNKKNANTLEKQKTPIEQKMAEVKFCEIDYHNLLLPNVGTELYEDGTWPLVEIPIQQLFYILKEDVMEYFPHLQKEFNTPLQIKRFKESEDYDYWLWILRQDKEELLNNIFYSVRKISKDEIYNLNKKCFEIYFPEALHSKFIYLDSRDKYFSGNIFSTYGITEDTAYNIETNDCEIVFFVKFSSKTKSEYWNKQAICYPRATASNFGSY